MKRPTLFHAAIALLLVSNAFVLIHAMRNRSGEPEAEIELTEREIRYYPHGSDDSSLTLMLLWQNPAAEYGYPSIASVEPGFFDRAKLEEIGFDLSVPPEAKQADRFYRGQRSRGVYAALEYDGAAWQAWLKQREAGVANEVRYGSQIKFEDRLRLLRETESRLVAVDVGLDPAALRRKFPDRKKVMILPGLAHAVLVPVTHVLRGAITSIPVDNINVPDTFRPQLGQQTYFSGWRTEANGTVIIDPPAFAVAIRVGSYYEPWVEAIRTLRK